MNDFMRKPYEKPTITTLSTKEAKVKMDKNEQLLDAIKTLLEKMVTILIALLLVAGICMLLFVVWWLFSPDPDAQKTALMLLETKQDVG